MNTAWALLLGGRLLTSGATTDALSRVETRTRIVVEQRDEARARARREAFLSYRFLRLQQASVFIDSDTRRVQTAALGASLTLAQRSLAESEAYAVEVQQLAAEREVLQGRASRPVFAVPSDRRTARGLFGPGLSWPTRGTLLTAPGARADLATLVMGRADGASVLGRFGAIVRSPATARVRRIEPHASGGFSAVLEHKDGFVTVLGGLRLVTAALGAELSQDEPVGVLGRSLDGAPVLGFELWHGGVAVDPGRFTRKRKP